MKTYSTTEINKNFKIKVNGLGENILVGVSGLIARVGEEMANKLFDRAFASTSDKQVCKLRRGIKVTFYAI